MTARQAERAPALEGRRRSVVIAVALANGLGAVAGGVGLLRDAEGMGYREAWLRGPFDDYTIPGAFLLVVIGGGMLIVAALAAADSPAARPAMAAMGLVLLAWLIIETIVIGYRGPVQIGFLVACGASGVALVHCARARPHG